MVSASHRDGRLADVAFVAQTRRCTRTSRSAPRSQSDECLNWAKNIPCALFGNKSSRYLREVCDMPTAAQRTDQPVANELGENTVRSYRRYDNAALRVDFQMWTLPPAIAAMDGN